MTEHKQVLFIPPPKEFTDLLLEPTTKGTQNTLTITKHNPSAFLERL